MRGELYDVDEVPSIDLKVRHQDSLTSFTASKLNNELDSFRQRHGEKFRNAYMGLDLKKTGIKVRGVEEYSCKINMVTDKGNFHATSKGIGVIKAVHDALKGLETQIERKIAKFYERVSAREDYPHNILEEN